VVGEGQTLDGTYHLQRLVGEGGMGAVYEATHARLAGRYAIKVLLRELSDSPEVRDRFDREARITSLLQHPNIVQVIDHNSTVDGTSYLVMEFLAGESLAARLAREGRLAVPAVVDIVDQIAAGLAAAHARGIVHRDLKPDNIFLVPVEGRASELIKILDFGISKVSWGRDAIDGELCGTPQYMAPEQADGRARDVDASTDQYALAVIAHELLTGENPFAAETLEAALARVAIGNVPPTGLAGELDAVLQRALSKGRARRFPSVSAFAEAFRAAALAQLPAPAAPVRAVTRRPRRRGRDARVGFAAAAAIAITSFFGTGAAHRAPPPAADALLRAPTVVPPAPEAVPPAPEAILADSAPPVTLPSELPSSEERALVRRLRVGRKAGRDRSVSTIEAGPVRRPSRPALAPDEDATLPPSDL